MSVAIVYFFAGKLWEREGRGWTTNLFRVFGLFCPSGEAPPNGIVGEVRAEGFSRVI